MSLKKFLLSATGLLTLSVPTSLSVIACDSNSLKSETKPIDWQIVKEINNLGNSMHEIPTEQGTNIEKFTKNLTNLHIKNNLSDKLKASFNEEEFEIITIKDSVTQKTLTDEDFSILHKTFNIIINYKYKDIDGQIKTSIKIIENTEFILEWINNKLFIFFMDTRLGKWNTEKLKKVINGKWIYEYLDNDLDKEPDTNEKLRSFYPENFTIIGFTNDDNNGSHLTDNDFEFPEDSREIPKITLHLTVNYKYKGVEEVQQLKLWAHLS